jgi:hypothetical protein
VAVAVVATRTTPKMLVEVVALVGGCFNQILV